MWRPLNRNQIFNDFSKNFSDPDYILQRAILTPLNDDADDINQYASELLPGQCKNYLSLIACSTKAMKPIIFIIQSF